MLLAPLPANTSAKEGRTEPNHSGQSLALSSLPLPYLSTLLLLGSLLTHTSPTWQKLVPSGTLAVVAAKDVDVFGILLAGALPTSTFVHIWEYGQ